MLVTRPEQQQEGSTSTSAPPRDSADTGASGANSSADAGEEGGGAAGAEKGKEAEGLPLVELKSFTTQVFFASWRAIHLGLLQVRCWRT